MTDLCIRGRSVVTRPVGNKVVLLTGNSMLGNYSTLTAVFNPAGVYEINPATGLCYASDGYSIIGYDDGWYGWAPDGISRLSIAPYMMQLAVAAGHASSISIINMAQGGTDGVDWIPGGQYWRRMTTGLAALALQGIVPDLHIHYRGCWDVLRGYSDPDAYGHLNFFADQHKRMYPNLKLKVGKRMYINGVTPERMAEVWNGMYRVIIDRNDPYFQSGPDDDIHLTYVVDGVHYVDVSRFYVCQQWTPFFAGI